MANTEGRFVDLVKIGEGRYGVVYKATDRRSNCTVALKDLCLSSNSEGVPCTAIREASLLKNLHHDNIVKLYDVVMRPSALTLVFECLDMDLETFLEKHTTPSHAASLPVAVHFARQICAGMAYCHEKRVLHRDLKPQNILLRASDLSLKLGDFGLGRAVEMANQKLTADVVTLWYRSPDVLLGSMHYDGAIDVWSIGCIFAEMLLGKPLFGDTSNEIEQLARIFKTLGRPQDWESQWPSLTTYPNATKHFGHPKLQNPSGFPPYISGRFADDAIQQRLLHIAGAHGVDLLCQMLRYEPSTRIKAAAALAHPLFESVRPTVIQNASGLGRITTDGHRPSVASVASSSYLAQSPDMQSAQSSLEHQVRRVNL